LSNIDHDLVLEDIKTNEGDITIIQKDSENGDSYDITISKDIIMEGGGNLVIRAGDDIFQKADLEVSSDGDITITAGDNIICDEDSSTTLDKGNVTYDAENIVLPSIDPNSAWLIINGNDIVNSTGAVITVPFVHIENYPGADKDSIAHLFENNGYSNSSIWLNGRLVGGLHSKDSTFVRESASITSAHHDLGYSQLYTNSKFSSLHITDEAWENKKFSWSADSNEWNFNNID